MRLTSVILCRASGIASSTATWRVRTVPADARPGVSCSGVESGGWTQAPHQLDPLSTPCGRASIRRSPRRRVAALDEKTAISGPQILEHSLDTNSRLTTRRASCVSLPMSRVSIVETANAKYHKTMDWTRPTRKPSTSSLTERLEVRALHHQALSALGGNFIGVPNSVAQAMIVASETAARNIRSTTIAIESADDASA